MQRATPTVAEAAVVSEMAYLVGDVTIDKGASVWMRGVSGPIAVGSETNVQDFTILHEAEVGSGVTTEHNAVIDRSTVGEDVFVGISSTILPETSVSDESIVTADSLVGKGQENAESHMAYGEPAESRPLDDEHLEQIQWYTEEYLTLAERDHHDRESNVRRGDNPQ